MYFSYLKGTGGFREAPTDNSISVFEAPEFRLTEFFKFAEELGSDHGISE